MTLRTNARLAGAMFLLYIATGLTSLTLSTSYAGAAGAAVELATVARHAPLARLNVLLTLLQVAYARVIKTRISRAGRCAGVSRRG